jgi:cytochrome c biogenesis protein CcmG/thiol:disulfide interchange protein DsbE
LAIASAAAGAAPAAKAGPAPDAAGAEATGGPARLPDFSLPDLDGKAHASKDWKGKLVLVDFWATWCAACRETIPALARLQEKHGSRGLAVVGISLDKGPKSKVSRFAKKMKINYQVLLDSEDTLSKVFGFEGLPSLYLFDREGRLIKAMTGYTAEKDKELEALVAGLFGRGGE